MNYENFDRSGMNILIEFPCNMFQQRMWACTRYRARALNRLKLCPILCKPCSSFKAPLRYSNSLSLIQLATSFIMPSLPRSSFSPSSFSFQLSCSSSLSRLYLSPVLPFAVPTTFTSLNLLRKSPPSLASPRLAPRVPRCKLPVGTPQRTAVP